MSTLKIVVASTRPGRLGPAVGDWFADRARRHGGFDSVEVLDLAEIDLPMFDEPHHPKTGRYQHQHTHRWSAAIAGAGAIVFVSPEYNGFPPPSLFNAIDYLHAEWAGKPAGIVTYGAAKGGARAAGAIEQLTRNIRMTPSQAGFPIPDIAARVVDGTFAATGFDDRADDLLDDLRRLDAELAPVRIARAA